MSDNSNLANSIWPNGMKVDSDGYAVFYPLGTNKIDVPTNTSDWPEGDKLVFPFVYQDDKLVGFCDTKAMTVDGQTSITLNYEHIEADFSSIEEGMLAITAPNAITAKYIWANSSSSDTGNSGDTDTLKYKGCTTVDEVKAVDPDYLTNDIIDGAWTEGLGDLGDGYYMFYCCLALTSFTSDLSSLTTAKYMFENCDNLTSFSSDLSSLTNGFRMFYNCTALNTFSSDLSSLTSGSNMFKYCTNLTSFNSDLSSLTNGNSMFYNCTNLTSFNSDLSSLTNGKSMFYGCTNFTSFTSDLSSLTDGSYMFHGCTNFTSFSSDLRSLTNGEDMFYGCTNLTSFSSDLKSLTKGSYMFRRCKLDTASVQNIADTINTPTSKVTIDIGIGNTTPNEQEEEAFNMIASKNWTVYVGVNGGNPEQWNPTATTPIDGEQTTTPIPFWAKPVPATEETAEYVDEQGNYYNVLGGNYIYGDDISTYGMFISEEDAAANMRLTKIERN